MTPSQRDHLRAVAASWRAVAAAASSNKKAMHAVGVRSDRVVAAAIVAERAEQLARELDELAEED